LLIISIIYNIVIWLAIGIPLYIEEQRYGAVSAESVNSIVLPAIPLVFIGVFVCAIAISPNKDGSDKVTKKAVGSGVVLAVIFLSIMFVRSMIN
jgi:hypothetical protein